MQEIWFHCPIYQSQWHWYVHWKTDHFCWNTPHTDWSTGHSFVNIHSWQNHITQHKQCSYVKVKQEQWIFCVVCLMCLTRFFFDHLKAYHEISPKPEMKQALMLLTSYIPYFTLPGLNVKLLRKPMSRWILDKDTGSIYKQITYMLQKDDTKLYRNEKMYQWTQRTLPYIHYKRHTLAESGTYLFYA